MTAPTIRSAEMSKYLRPAYSARDLEDLEGFLFSRGVLSFQPLATGLYPAAQVDPSQTRSGYHNVWVRDNVFVAHALAVNGRRDGAAAVAQGLAGFFRKHLFRFNDVNAGAVDRNDPMNRPHIRFDGESLAELPERWAHAQNDALGYFVWLYCSLAVAGAIPLTGDGLALLETFAAYFEAIRFWEDEDSGHWEEVRKVNASSIGAVIGGLEAMKALLETRGRSAGVDPVRIDRTVSLVADLIARGRTALDAILPAECIQPQARKRRRFDAALLFLVYPLGVVDQAMADRIVGDVAAHLQGDLGVRRYIGDSYWCADYRELFPPEERSADFSRSLKRRDRLLKKGQEAQWCIFDPILSAIFGRRYQRSGAASDRQRQIDYFNRSLGQITTALQCPEAYFLERGAWVPNDNAPLLWAEANLWLALRTMKDAAARDAGRAAPRASAHMRDDGEAASD